MLNKVRILALATVVSSNCIGGFASVRSVEFTSDSLKGQAQPRPNIVLIVADDLGYGDLGCYGQKKVQTPNIDKLAAEGMLFTQYYAGTAVCAPSRSSLLTGQDTGHTPIRGNKSVEPEGQWPLDENALTVAELLQQAGYTTGAFGKWGLGYIDTEGDPDHQGFNRFFGFNCQSLAHNYYPDHLWDNRHRVDLPSNTNAGTGTYAPYLIHEQALAFMEANKEGPFFLYYPTTLPHAELLVPDKEMAPFRGKFNPEKPYTGSGPEDSNFRKGPYSSQSEPHAAFAAMITILDRQVGELMKKLDDLGIADKTIVMFTSDNGPHLEGGADPDYFDSNSNLRGYKRDLYEGGIRVPFIARWKGRIPAGRKTDEVAAAWDVLPTLAALTQVSAPPSIQGHSLLPTILGNGKQTRHKYLYWEFHEGGGTKAIRQGQWKLVCRNVLDPAKATYELYDLKTDISEQHDVASSNAEIVGRLKKLMAQARIPSQDFPF